MNHRNRRSSTRGEGAKILEIVRRGCRIITIFIVCLTFGYGNERNSSNDFLMSMMYGRKESY